MKKALFTFAAIVGLSLFSNAQVVLEHSYAFSPSNYYRGGGLTLVKLDVSGDKYLLYDIADRKIKLYNLNHSIFKSFSIPPLSRYRTYLDSSVSIAYISENLFNSDNLIEFVAYNGFYTGLGSNGSDDFGSTSVFNELGNVVFNGDSMLPVKKGMVLGEIFPGGITDFIFNTSSGTKMFLYTEKNNTPRQMVYSLPGTLVAAVKNEEVLPNSLMPYPNPASDKITIAYKLDNGKEGKLVISDLNGRSLLEYRIDNVFDNVIIDTKSLQAGSYQYTIYSSDKKLSSGKFIVAN